MVRLYSSRRLECLGCEKMSEFPINRYTDYVLYSIMFLIVGVTQNSGEAAGREGTYGVHGSILLSSFCEPSGSRQRLSAVVSVLRRDNVEEISYRYT